MVEGMVEVCFLPAQRIAWVRPGTTILAAGAAAGVEILTGCQRGMCGTDPVRIVAGAQGLETPADHERGTLERMGLSEEYRLSCSARLVSGSIRVELGEF